MKVNKETADAPRAKEKYIPLKSNAHGEFREAIVKFVDMLIKTIQI